MTLIVIHCNGFDSCDGGIFKVATELSVLMKVYTVPCHDRGHINAVLVYRAAQILCKFCQVHLVRHFCHLMVHMMSVM